MKMCLNLGCGTNIKKSTKEIRWVNVDKAKLKGVDVVVDLNRLPWRKFKDNTFDEIYCKDILEHLENVVGVMEEIHRIAKPKAMVRVFVPYYASKVTFVDPTHKRGFTEHSFDYFTEGEQYSNYNFYTNARFEIIKTNFITYGNRKYIPFKSILKHFLLNIVDVITFEMRVIK